MPTPFQPKTIYDAIGSFGGGVNEGDSPLDIAPNVMAGAINTTVRGKYVTHRPAYWKRPVTYQNVTGQFTPTKTAVEKGVFQGGCYGTDDAGNVSFVALISGRVFQFLVQNNVITCAEILLSGGLLSPVQPQAWLWQSERWIIISDGKNQNIFVDLGTAPGEIPILGSPRFATAIRANSPETLDFDTTTTSKFTTGIPKVGSSDTINFTDVSSLVVDDIVTIPNIGTFQVITISTLTVTLTNLTGVNAGSNVAVGTTVTWSHVGTQLPPCRMGAYGMGRNWVSLPQGLQFIGGDIVMGSSGTQAYGFRDAVLYINENNFISGGGAFTIPASGGETIQAFLFTATLDASLGQGPLQVFTNYRVFSCNAPVDRLNWQSMTNPILTVSLICNGAESQDSTINVNGDAIFRSLDGERSLLLARRDFFSWGNVPISFEVNPTLSQDDDSLLNWCSRIVFDNRSLLTVGPVQHAQGVYFTGILPTNYDPISSMGNKSKSVFDSGIWTGMNVLKLMTGEVQGVQRAFAFVLNLTTGIEIWEILPSTGPLAETADNDGVNSIPIVWQFDSPSLRFGVDKRDHQYMYLSNGEIWVDNMVDDVTFSVFYRPDLYPCWTQWRKWTSNSSITCGAASETCKKTRTPFSYQQVYVGIGAPTISPQASSAVYFDMTNPSQPGVWYWANQTWTKFIG